MTITTPAEVREWRCFHCDEVFTERPCAAAHFGANEDAEPACQIKMGGERTLLEALRRAEKDAGDAWAAIHAESTEAARAYYAQQGRHAEQLTAAEQVGYERGLRDAQAHPETLGLASLAELARLSAALGRQSDNMAFLLNHAPIVQHWYDKFTAELAEDRTALQQQEARDGRE